MVFYVDVLFRNICFVGLIMYFGLGLDYLYWLFFILIWFDVFLIYFIFIYFIVFLMYVGYKMCLFLFYLENKFGN